MSEGFFIDHVIYGVQDVDATAEWLRSEYGLGSVPGGRHLGGTTNRLVPLQPPTVLELLGVGDTSKDDGAWLSQALAGTDRVIWWVLGVADLDDTAARRGLPVQSGEMALQDGSTITFRTAGMPRYPLPFFIGPAEGRRDPMDVWRERYDEAAHDCTPGTFTFVEVGGDPALMNAYLGDHDLPLRFRPEAPPGITATGIATDRGEVVLSMNSPPGRAGG